MTIEELASIAEHNSPNRNDFETGYRLGAKAVLKEISDILDVSKPYLGNPFASTEERVEGVYFKIEELLGK